ncbi:hypothetical protein CEE39_06300 [bacterium (candidate division B38) B3_B38]|nr:MAG: hypothetical protein CEE39_06300 [bacterium (candidate division B38) B3_B38]
MSDLCKWLHEQLESLPTISSPFSLENLPENGIYFFYENGEIWGHYGNKPRIVRIGTHTGERNFRSRINQHYLLDESKKMNFEMDKPKISDRSIFRKNIVRGLLNREKDGYLEIWNIDFTKKLNTKLFGHLRNIEKEKRLESKITIIIRERFSFKFIVMDSQKQRKRLERSLIGTIASCKLCKPSGNWLGNYSPKRKIEESGLWLEQNLTADKIDENDKDTILNAISRTKKWITCGL